LIIVITISLYTIQVYGQVGVNGVKTWVERENNIKILLHTRPEQPTISTPSVLRFTVQNLQTGKPVANLLANVVIVGGTQESPFRLSNISAVDGDFSINVIFPDKGSYQVITKIISSSQTHDIAALASFTAIVPATQSALNLFGINSITWISLIITSAIGVASFLILKNKKILNKD